MLILVWSLTAPGIFPLKLDEGDSSSFSATCPYFTLDRVICIQYCPSRLLLLFSSMCSTKKINFYVQTGLHNLLQPGSQAARKWRENEKMKRKWRKIHSLHFLIFSLFPPSLSISYNKICRKMLNIALLLRISQKFNTRAMRK